MSTKFKFQLGLLFAALAAAIYFFPGPKTSLPSHPAKKTVYYKWQDAQGQWHMADRAPEGIDAERLVADPNANLIQGVSAPEPTPVADTQPLPEGQIPLDYLRRAKQILQDAEQARNLLNQRQQELDDFVLGSQP